MTENPPKTKLGDAKPIRCAIVLASLGFVFGCAYQGLLLLAERLFGSSWVKLKDEINYVWFLTGVLLFGSTGRLTIKAYGLDGRPWTIVMLTVGVLFAAIPWELTG